MTTPPAADRSPRWMAFIACQLAFFALAGGATAWRVEQLRDERALPPLRDVPLEVRPQYDFPTIVSDAQLEQVLARLQPRDRGAALKINDVDHALRFWGVEARFAEPGYLSGEAMRELLLDHRRFAERYGDDVPPLLIDTDDGGVRVRFVEGERSASHYDHTLAGLAEVGTPLDFPVVTPNRQTTYRALIEQSLRDFSLNQHEYEWSALAYTLLLMADESGNAPRQWLTSEGQRIDFDRIADRIMRQDLPQGVCAAHHRMHALVMMLRVDDEAGPLLSAAARQRIIEYLQSVTDQLVRHQHPAGYWTMSWPEGADDGAPESRAMLDPLAARVLATGHPLEWWALAPAEVHPPRHVLVAAGQWLARTISELPDSQIDEYYTFLSHAGRALSLWRGQFPHESTVGGTAAVQAN